MHILKRFFAGVCASLLVCTLFGLGLTWSISKLASGPEALKAALKDSGIYQTGISSALNQAFKDKPSSDGEGIPIDDPGIRDAVAKALPPEALQAQTESVLDAVYAWVQGEKPLTAVIDLTEAKQRLADSLGAYAQQRVATLPACGSGGSSEDFNPFGATCAPANINSAEAAAKIKEEILHGEFLKESSFDLGTLKLDNGKTIQESFGQVPDIYEKANWVPYGFAAAALLSMLGIIFLSDSRRRGIRKVGVILLVIGSLSALASWLGGIGLHKLVVSMNNSGAEGTLQHTAARIAELVVNNFRMWWIVYGVVLAVLGIATLVALRFWKPGGAAAETPSPKTETPEPDHAAEAPATPPVADKKTLSKKPPRKIQ